MSGLSAPPEDSSMVWNMPSHRTSSSSCCGGGCVLLLAALRLLGSLGGSPAACVCLGCCSGVLGWGCGFADSGPTVPLGRVCRLSKVPQSTPPPPPWWLLVWLEAAAPVVEGRPLALLPTLLRRPPHIVPPYRQLASTSDRRACPIPAGRRRFGQQP